MTRRMRIALAITSMLTGAFILGACEEGSGEKAGRKVDEAVGTAGEKVESALDKAGDAIKDATK